MSDPGERPEAHGRQIVVVTGASAGIGRAAAHAFAGRGAAVALLARGARGLEAVAREVRSAGGRPLTIGVDVSDAAAVDAAATQVERELGPIDVWVNAAFTTVFAPVQEVRPEEYERVTRVTYLGFVHGTQAALRRMVPRDRGTIVQVGSALAHRGIPLQSAYCAAKHAIQGFHESLRCELLHDHSRVRVTMVHLPGVNTPQFSWVVSRLPRHPMPMPPIYQPEVAAKGILYAADHPKRREHWVAGSTVGTLIGNRLVPGLLDRYLARNGYSSQQADRPRDPDQATNLWSPADDTDGHDHGTHGVFDDKATSRSVQLWASRHRGLLAAVGTATGTAACALAARRARS